MHDSDIERLLAYGARRRCSDLSALDELLEAFDADFIERYKQNTLHWLAPTPASRSSHKRTQYCELDPTSPATLVALRKVYGESGRGYDCAAPPHDVEQPPAPAAVEPQQPASIQQPQPPAEQPAPRDDPSTSGLWARLLTECLTPNEACEIELQSSASATAAGKAKEQQIAEKSRTCAPSSNGASTARVAYVLLTSPFERRTGGRGQGPVDEGSVLRMHLRALIALPTTLITTLLIMLPSEPGRRLVPGYLDIEPEAAGLPFPARLVRLPNNTLGSYGGYLEAYRRTAASSSPFEYLIFSEDDYIPVRSHFDASLVRMYTSSFADNHGVLCGLLQGRPLEPSSPYQLHAESSHIMSASTLSRIFSHTYGSSVKWSGDLVSRMFHLLEVKEGVHVDAYYDRLQLGFGALMRDCNVPMKDWTAAYRTPYWSHEYIADWSGAGHDWRVPTERVLFAPIQWPFTERIRLCCSPEDCINFKGSSCSLQRAPSLPQKKGNNGCCPESGVITPELLRVRVAASVPSNAVDAKDVQTEANSNSVAEHRQRRRACTLNATRLTQGGRTPSPARTTGEFLEVDTAEHEAYTASLRGNITPKYFSEALGGVDPDKEEVLPSAPARSCCSHPGRPAIWRDADPQHTWFGDLTCIECEVCRNATNGNGNGAATVATSTVAAHRKLAILMLGHRRRLVFETVVSQVIKPSAQSGHSVTLFAYLENSTMWTPYLKQGGEIQEHPVFRRLNDAQLRARLGALVRSVGGRVGSILIDKRPNASFPPSNSSWADWRLFHYDDNIRQTVATALKKELIGYRLVTLYEQQRMAGRKFDWLLLLREDAHFFAPLDLSRFQTGAVHGKGCGRYGGWNDHVYLIWRAHAARMLSSYRDLHTPRLESSSIGGSACWLGERIGKLTGEARWQASKEATSKGVPMDLLSCSTSEMWRDRVGKLWGIPYMEHPPEVLPTADVRLVAPRSGRDVDSARDASEFGWAEAGDSGVVSCFPSQYALANIEDQQRCVPLSAVGMVVRRTCRDASESWSPWDEIGFSSFGGGSATNAAAKARQRFAEEQAEERLRQAKTERERLQAIADAADLKARAKMEEEADKQREALAAAARRGIHYNTLPRSMRRGAMRNG